jgi:hypothetical protein
MVSTRDCTLVAVVGVSWIKMALWPQIIVGKSIDGRLARIICISVLEFDDGVGVIKVLGWGQRARVEDDISRVRRHSVVGIVGGIVHVGVVSGCRAGGGVVEEVGGGVAGPSGVDVDVGLDVCVGAGGKRCVDVAEGLDVGVAVQRRYTGDIVAVWVLGAAGTAVWVDHDLSLYRWVSSNGCGNG